MELSQTSLSHIEETILKAVSRYTGSKNKTIVTDIHLQPRQDIGRLLIFDDEDTELAGTAVEEWATYAGDDFYSSVEDILKTLLNKLKRAGAFERINLLKPFSFVLVNDEKETLAELLLMDDDTLLLNDELLKGLDEELDAFLKKLLEK